MDFHSFINRIPNLGSEISIKSTLFETLTFENRIGSSIFQLYLPVAHPNNPYTFKKFTTEDLNRSRFYAFQSKLRFYVHTPFSTNISKEDSTRSINMLIKESAMFNGFDASLVMHVGRVGKLENVIYNLNENIIRELKTGLLLENSASQGTELGRSVDDFRLIFEGLEDNGRIRYCLDTQHAFASSLCKFDSSESVVELIDSFYEATSQYPKLIHLNDSAKPFGSKVDRHQTLGKGYIWSDNNYESLFMLFDMSRDKGIDLILETPDPVLDLYLLNKLF